MRQVMLPLPLVFACWASNAQAPARLEFEVASIKPSPPAYQYVRCRGGAGQDDPGMWACENITLANYVTIAYSVELYQLSAPDWMSNARFNLQAKIPEGTTREQQSVMLQNLLADRFKLRVHRETREIQQFDLVVAKGGPKFKEAAPPDPKNAASAATPAGPIKLGPDGYPALPRGRATMAVIGDRVRIYNPEMTMERLVIQLAAQLHIPVTDATGLKGKYEITLSWSGDNGTRLDANSDPGPTLEAAVREQLGLRLEPKKGPVDFIVVDSCEKTPSEN
jgi:uncharacterized protein (TIGR03435 family)